jgi:nitrogen-specific signal transduction histidine kinase
MEVDESLRIVKANEHAGIILGRSASELVKQNLRRCVTACVVHRYGFAVSCHSTGTTKGPASVSTHDC